MGWPLRGGRRYREFGGSFIYPLGESLVALGMVVGLDYADATLSVHDLLQELKGHPFVRRHPRGREAGGLGRQDDPRGRLPGLPDRFHFPGGMIVGDGAGLVNVPALKGIHYAMRSGMLAAETAVEALGPGRDALDARRARVLRRSAARELRLEGPRARSQHAAGVQARLRPRRLDRGRGD